MTKNELFYAYFIAIIISRKIRMFIKYFRENPLFKNVSFAL